MSLSTMELARLIGRTGHLRVQEHNGTIHVPVTVTDARQAWGNVRVQVRPRGGLGQCWVGMDRVSFKKQGEDNDPET